MVGVALKGAVAHDARQYGGDQVVTVVQDDGWWRGATAAMSEMSCRPRTGSCKRKCSALGTAPYRYLVWHNILCSLCTLCLCLLLALAPVFHAHAYPHPTHTLPTPTPTPTTPLDPQPARSLYRNLEFPHHGQPLTCNPGLFPVAGLVRWPPLEDPAKPTPHIHTHPIKQRTSVL